MHQAIRHEMLKFTTTGRRSVLDLTDDITLLIMKYRMNAGVVHIKATHTTARVVEQENEPMFHEDLFDHLDRLAPPDGDYRHDKIGTLRTVNVCDGECENGWAHIQATYLPSSVTIQVSDGERVKGLWDRVLLFELDHRPRERNVSVTLIGIFDDSETSAESTVDHPAVSKVVI